MPDTGGGAAAPYTPRKRRRKPLTKIATGLRARKPPPPKMVGGGVAAPGPYTTEPVKSGRSYPKPMGYQGRKPTKPKARRRATNRPKAYARY